ncbi:MAG: signal recognition particle-docking protein FtsY [Actinomycetaceae bacterium]|nr:signal recognition particle-docking protein FtsY [Actinomycetaceae bacterium]
MAVISVNIIIAIIVTAVVVAAGIGVGVAIVRHSQAKQLDYEEKAQIPAPPEKPEGEEDPEALMAEIAEQAVKGDLHLRGRETHRADGRGYDTPRPLQQKVAELEEQDEVEPTPSETKKEDLPKVKETVSEDEIVEEETTDVTQEEKSPPLDSVEPVPGRMVRLRSRLAKSGAFGRALLAVFGRGDLSIDDWEEIEDTLLLSDLGVEATEELMEELRTQAKVLGTNDAEAVKKVLYDKLLELLRPEMDRSLSLDKPTENLPATLLTVGVNGTGKTTTIGKIARLLVSENYSVLLGAADTFRAAAADQLQTWGERVGVGVVRSDKEGADPASVAFEALDKGAEEGTDVVLVDTAGRLQNKQGLMDELGKIKRVMEKKAPVNETLLVLDATTGQNGLQQARVFAEVVNVTGIVLTKLDGSAKGGIVVRVQRELGVPVKLVGLGEGPDDLAPFDPEQFAQALIEDE